MDQVQAPYYIEYRVNDVDDYTAEAAFGALVQSQRVHVRILRVVVRIGDYKQDSYFSQGVGETNILPLDNDPIALRHQIWTATDEAYKSAGEAFAEKQAALKQFSADPNAVDDFAKEPEVIALEPVVTLKVDQKEWKKTLEDVTELYKQYPDVQTSTASARFTGVNEYFVNSEGTVTRDGRATYSVQLNSAAQAARRDARYAQSGVDGGACGGIAEPRCFIERCEKNIGDGGGVEECADRGRGIPRSGFVCAGRRG